MGYWDRKRVTVTGGAGFFGRYVVEKLKAHGANEIFVPLSREYDLRDIGETERMLSDARPDVVIHMAARVGGIGANKAHPAEFFYDNLMMGAPLMHASWRAGVKKFVAIGTVCAYPKFTPIPFREEAIWDGYPEETNAPYGIAKKMLLVQAQAYREQYGFNAIFLLPVNLYGPGDKDDLEGSHVIPAIVRKCLEAKRKGDGSITLWGDGSPTREFLYAGDGSEGVVLATEKYDKPEPVNIGSAFEISIKDLAGMIVRLTGFNGSIEWDTSKPNGQPRRKLDTSRAEIEFGFRAGTSFEKGLGETIRWYRKQYGFA